MFPTMKKKSRSVNDWWSYCKSSATRFCETV